MQHGQQHGPRASRDAQLVADGNEDGAVLRVHQALERLLRHLHVVPGAAALLRGRHLLQVIQERRCERRGRVDADEAARGQERDVALLPGGLQHPPPRGGERLGRFLHRRERPGGIHGHGAVRVVERRAQGRARRLEGGGRLARERPQERGRREANGGVAVREVLREDGRRLRGELHVEALRGADLLGGVAALQVLERFLAPLGANPVGVALREGAGNGEGERQEQCGDAGPAHGASSSCAPS